MLINPVTKRFGLEQYELDAGIVITTWYTAFQDINCKIYLAYFEQENTTPQANNMDFRYTIDGEVFTMLNVNILNNTPMFLAFDQPGGGIPDVGVLPVLRASQNTWPLGIICYETGGVNMTDWVKFSGKNVHIEYSFDAVGANQVFKMDIYYEKME